MALGYCNECGRLVTILPGERHEAVGRSSRRWYPVKHPKLGDDTGGEDCPGVKKEI